MTKILISVVGLICALATSAYGSQEEVLRGFNFDENGVYFRVYDGGCTQKSHFFVDLRFESTIPVLTLWRTYPDICGGSLRNNTVITFTFAELGLSRGQRFKVGNIVGELSFGTR